MRLMIAEEYREVSGVVSALSPFFLFPSHFSSFSSRFLCAEVDGEGGAGGSRKRRQLLQVDDDINPALLRKEKAGTLSSSESKELKRQRRILKNRLAAQMFRKRQRDHLAELEKRSVDEQKKNTDTKNAIEALKKRNEKTRQEIGHAVDALVATSSVKNQ